MAVTFAAVVVTPAVVSGPAEEVVAGTTGAVVELVVGAVDDGLPDALSVVDGEADPLDDGVVDGVVVG